MAISESLVVELEIKADGTIKGFSKVNKASNEAAKSLLGLDKGLASLQKQFSAIAVDMIALNQGFELLAKGFRVLSSAVSVTVGEFAQFEKALVGVGKTTDIEGNMLTEFGQDMVLLSESIPVAREELLSFAQTAGQLGVRGTATLENFAETLAKLAVATNLTGEEAAIALTRILNVTRESVDNIDELGASITALGNTFATSEQEIAIMGRELSRSTAQFKLTSAEVLGLSAAMSDLGILAQVGGSAVGRVFRELDMIISQGGRQLQSLSELLKLSAEDIRTSFDSKPIEIFNRFIGALNMDVDNASQILAKFNLRGDEINKVIPVIAKSFDTMTKAINTSNKAFDENIALDREANKVFATLDASFTKTINSLKNLGLAIGALLAPLAQFGLSIVQNIIQPITRFLEQINRLDLNEFGRSLFYIATGFTAIGIAIKSSQIIAFIPTLISGIKTLAIAAVPLGIVALKFIAIGAAVTAVAIGIDLLVRNFELFGKLAGRVLVNVFIRLEELSLSIKRTFLDIGMKLKEFGIISDKVVRSLAESVNDSVNSVGNLKRTLFTLNQDIDKGFENFDMGILGQGIELVNNLLGDTTKQTEELTKAQQDQQKETKRSIVLTEEQIKAIEQLTLETKTLMEANESIGASTLQRIEQQLKIDLLRLDAKQSQLNAEGKLTEEAERQLMLQRQLLKERSELQKREFLKEEPIVSQDQTDKFANVFGEVFANGASLFSNAFTKFIPIVGQLLAVANIFSAVLDIIPNLLNSFANLFDKITDFPQVIFNALKNLGRAFADLIKDFLPNLLNAVTDILILIVEEFPDMILDAIDGLFEGLFAAFERLLENLPNIIVNIFSKLLILFPKILISLTKNFIKFIPLFIKEFIKAIPEIAKAFVVGIAEAIKELFSSIFGGGAINKIGQSVSKGLSKAFTGVGENLFKVIDLQAASRGIEQVKEIAKISFDFLKGLLKAFRFIFQTLEKIWNFVYEKILKPFLDALQAIWEFAEDVFESGGKFLKETWTFIKDKIIQPIVNAFEKVFNFINDNIFEPFVKAVETVFNFVNDKIFAPILKGFKELFDFVDRVIIQPIQKLVEGFIKIMAAVLNPIIDLINALKLPEVKVSGKILGQKFSFTLIPEIDLIPGTLPRIGDSGGGGARGGGAAPSSPNPEIGGGSGGFGGGGGGELPPGALSPTGRGPGGLLEQNQGFGLAAQPTTQTNNVNQDISIKIETTQTIDESFIRDRLMPALKNELKRNSTRGGFTLSTNGLRAT